jgi:hypothetical protein
LAKNNTPIIYKKTTDPYKNIGSSEIYTRGEKSKKTQEMCTFHYCVWGHVEESSLGIYLLQF